jgi:exonuclease III
VGFLLAKTMQVFLMNNSSSINYSEWSVLSHNVRGINSSVKWNGLRCAIRESGCDVIFLQETKKEFFDEAYLKTFCPNYFDSFAFVPLVGNLGGSIIIWKSTKLVGNVIFQNDYAQSVEFISNLSNCSWIITNIYAPCTLQGKIDFLNWFPNINMASDKLWLIVVDFNLIRRSEDRNKVGG